MLHLVKKTFLTLFSNIEKLQPREYGADCPTLVKKTFSLTLFSNIEKLKPREY